MGLRNYEIDLSVYGFEVLSRVSITCC